MAKAVTRYTMIIWAILHLIDRGERLSADDVREHIEAGDIFEWLDSLFPGEVDVSLLQGTDRDEVMELFRAMNTVNSARKFGASKDGLCLLIAYATEGVQQATA